MLPRYDYLQSEPQLQKSRSKSPGGGGGGEYQESRNPLYVLQVYISAHSRTWLILAILSIQIFLLASLRSIHFSLTASPPKAVEAAVGGGDECSFGRVFVYDLPPMFNKDLVDNCESLNPWNSRCGALSNEGFGRPAGDGLAEMVPERLRSSWYWTDQFASEIIYHRRVLGHPCRTLNPSSATAFYVPFYGGLAVGKYLWSNYSPKDRDFHCRALLKWLQLQDTWKRSDGWDHFMMLGRITWDFRRSKDDDWGGSFLYMPEMQNVTRLLIERNPWDEFDVGVPYPTGFHPKTGSDLREWQTHVLNRNRSTLFGFAGATRSAFRDDFRGSLLTQCRESAGACRSVDCSGSRCSNGTSATMALFLDSKFCLQPRGDSFTRRSIFDCMIAGGIPVFFWRRSAYVQYTWHLPEDPTSYSVFIDRREVKNGTSIKMVLEGLGEKKIRAMREKVVENIPKLVYVAPKEGLKGIEDAFDAAINGVLRRFQKQKQQQQQQGDEA